MEMGLHAWLLVLLFCVTFTKGKADAATSDGEGDDKSQEDTDNSRETEQALKKRKVEDVKEKGNEETNPNDAKSVGKGPKQTKDKQENLKQKGQKKTKDNEDNLKEKGQKKTKDNEEDLKEKGKKVTKKSETNVKRKGEKPDEKNVVDSKKQEKKQTKDHKENLKQKGKKETKKSKTDVKTKGDETDDENVADSEKPEKSTKKKVKDAETKVLKKSKEKTPDGQKEGQQETKKNTTDLKRPDIPRKEQSKEHVSTPQGKGPKDATGNGKNLEGKGSPDVKQTKEGEAFSKRQEKEQTKEDRAILKDKAKAQRHPCLQKLKIGPCKATIPRFWFDGRKCDVFLWGGCKPNGNNFNSKSECEEKCLGRALPLECYEPKKEGPCKAAIKRWYFNGIRCKKFNWGGCKPNGNNFETKLQCKKTCTAPKVNCLDPLKTGPCQAAIPRFRFDGRSCTKFLWGGCNPNGNNFPSKLACKLTCHGKPPPPTCVGPRKIGPCKGAIPRWWFNGHVCKKFLWGGCAPNGNNYVSKKECEKTCVAPPPNCHDPQKKGPCKGSILRYWFSGKRCKSFFWGGCFPNGNNFHSRHECEKRCLGNSNSKNKIKSAAPKQELQESNLDEAEKLSI